MIDSLPVSNRTGAAGVIAQHSADIGTGAGRNVGRKEELVGGEVLVQIVQDDARLDPDDPALRIHVEDTVHVLREIQDHPRRNGLTRKARPSSPREDGNGVLGCQGDRRDDVAIMPRDDHDRRIDLVQTGIGAVESAGHRVGQNLAFDLPSKCLWERNFRLNSHPLKSSTRNRRRETSRFTVNVQRSWTLSRTPFPASRHRKPCRIPSSTDGPIDVFALRVHQ